MWTLVSVVVAAVPGLMSWWTGRQLLARRDDPALPERIMARANRVAQALAASVAIIFFVSPQAPWMLALPLLGLYVGGFPAHRVLHEERWGLGSYLLASGRWWLAVFGLWTLLAFTPSIIAAAGPARLPIAALLAVVLVAWESAYGAILRRVLGASALSREDLAPRFAAILAGASAAAPEILRFGFPGGRVVNAFALPSRRRGLVVFGDQLLELLEPDEIAAIFAHEVAHLEHFDGKRLVRGRFAMWTIIGLSVVVVPLLHQWTLGLSGYLEPVWVIAMAVGLALMGAARQKHEAESDLRAVELSGDPEALVRALVKLHALAHLPRRWALDFERNASHPSLARRVQGIRAAADTAPPRLDGPLVVPTTTAGAFVVLDSERAEWLEDVTAGTPLEPAALREHASRSRGWRYSELVELRVRPGAGDKVSLVATERSGRSWSVPLRREDVAVVQSALDVVDVRLAQRSHLTGWWSSLLVRAVAAVGIMAAMVATGALSIFVAGLITLIRPHMAPLAALAVTSIGAAFLAASQRDSTGDVPELGWIVLALLSAVALAALLVLRRTDETARDPRRRVAALTAGALGAVALASLIPFLGRSDPRPLDHWGVMAAIPSVLIAAAGAGAALLGRDRHWGRWTGIALVIAGLAPLGLAAAGPSATSGLQWPHVTPTLVSRTELDRQGIGLRGSPSGRRLAVRLVRRTAEQAPWAFRVLGAGNDRWELAADDLAFLDDERLIVLRREDTTLRLALIGGGGSTEPTWRVSLPDLVGAQLAVSPATGAWTVVGSERDSESVVVAVAGLVGRDETRVKRWALVPESEDRSTWAVTGPEIAFQVRTHFRDEWYWRWPLVPVLVGGTPFDSEIWRRGPDGDRRVASTGGVVRCTLSADGGVVCFNYGTTTRLAWVFREGSADPGGASVLPATTWKVGVFQNRLVGLTSSHTVLVLDEDGQRGVQLSLPPDAGGTVDALVSGERLAVLSSRPPGGAVSVYALP